MESLDCVPLFHRLSRSNSAQRFMTMCDESNSPSLSPWLPSALSPATWRVCPHEKSSKCQNAYDGRIPFQIGSDSRYTIIQPTYATLRDVMTISRPGRPSTIASRTSGIVVFGPPGMIEDTMR